jgi:hypothetical protein
LTYIFRYPSTRPSDDKLPAQNALSLLVDPSRRDQFCAARRIIQLSRPGRRRTKATKPSMNCRSCSFVVACEPAGSVEDGSRHGTGEGARRTKASSQGPQDRQPCILAEDRAEAAGRRPKYRHRLSAENPADVGRRPREPVNCVLEHARDRVLRRFDISVLERNPMDRLDREFRAVARTPPPREGARF